MLWRDRPSLLRRRIEPRRQRLYILRVDRRAAPDPKAGRRIAIGADIKGDFLFFEQARE